MEVEWLWKQEVPMFLGDPVVTEAEKRRGREIMDGAYRGSILRAWVCAAVEVVVDNPYCRE